MAIPKIDLPTYKLHLKSSNKEITFRPFLVKEEKVLLIALESNDYVTIVDAIKQVLNNCILSDVNLEELPLFEIEHLFLNLRARSMGEKVELTYICRNVVEDKRCGAEMELEVDLLQVALDMKTTNPVVYLDEKVGVKLKYPNIDTPKSLLNDKNEEDNLANLIKSCTEYLFDEQQTYKPEDMQDGEFEEFIENLTQEQFKKIKDFFEASPTVSYKGNVKCPKCEKEHDVLLEGILDFFE